MSLREITKIGKRGTIVIPAELRRRFDLKEGSQVIVEEREDGLSVRPAVTLPVEIYSPERKAEFLLNNAVSKDDYRWAVKRYDGWELTGQDHAQETAGGLTRGPRFSRRQRVVLGGIRQGQSFSVVVASEGDSIAHVRLRDRRSPPQSGRVSNKGERLARLVAAMEIVPGRPAAGHARLLAEIDLPEKDQPIVAAAIQGGAAHLLTGDRRHFGPWFGKRIGGVLVQTPAQYLARLSKGAQEP